MSRKDFENAEIGGWWLRKRAPYLNAQTPEHEMVTCSICGRTVAYYKYDIHLRSIPCSNIKLEQDLQRLGFIFIGNSRKYWLPCINKLNIEIKKITYDNRNNWRVFVPYWVRVVIDTSRKRGQVREYTERLIESVHNNIVAKSIIEKMAQEEHVSYVNKSNMHITDFIFLFGFDRKNLIVDHYKRSPHIRTTRWLRKITKIIKQDRYEFTKYEMMEIESTVKNYINFLKEWEEKNGKSQTQYYDVYEVIDKRMKLLQETIERVNNG